MRNSLPALLLVPLLSTLTLVAQVNAQHETAFDVVDGRQAYQLYCANCHGPDGDLVANVDLGHGNFRQPYTDAQLAALLRNGIPGTPMPGNPGMSDAQIAQIVVYLRSLGSTDAAVGGDAARGARLFAGKGECFACHRIAGQGSRLGPDLTQVGRLRSAAELEVSLRAPERVVLPAHRFYRVVTRRGNSASGRLLNQDAFSVQLLDTDEQLRSFDKSGLREHGFIDPGMPSVEGLLSDQEVADLVAYLVSLRG
jgi:putative heme-binding domain-containing protein